MKSIMNDAELRWVAVLVTNRMYEADLLSAELRRAGIPARVTQEAAGAALGLTTGKLGEITIQVPAVQVQDAQYFLAQFRRMAAEPDVAEPESETTYDPDDGVPIPDMDRDDGPDMFSRISRGALVLAAVAFSPIGVVLAVIGSWLSGRRDGR